MLIGTQAANLSSLAYGAGVELSGKSCIQASGLGEFQQLTLTVRIRPDKLPGDFNAILHTDGWNENGLHILLRPDGQLQVSVRGNRPTDAATPVRLESGGGRWYHLAIAYDAVARSCQVFLDGKSAATVTYARAVPVRLDRFCIGAWNGAERLLHAGLDDIRIYDRVLGLQDVARITEAKRIEPDAVAWWKLDDAEATVLADSAGRHPARLVAVVPLGAVAHRAPLTPEDNRWADRGIPSRYTFGAYYTRKNVDADWHLQSRTDEFADIMVKFGDGLDELVFWRGTGYRPCWKTSTGSCDFPELVERSGDGPPGCPDKMNRHTRARILESTPERVVIHWRYLTEFPAEVGLDNPPDQTKFVDEYFVIFPDRTVIRGVRRGTSRIEDWLDPNRLTITALRLTEDGFQEHPADPQVALMHQLMDLGRAMLPVPKAAEIRPVSESLPEPDITLRFDDASGRTTAVTVRGRPQSTAARVKGHAALWRTGISGTALAFDGWTSEVTVPGVRPAASAQGITLDAWIAIAAYPWNYCPVVQQGNVIREGSGWFLGLDPDGKPALALCIDGKQVLLQSPEQIPRFRWSHVSGCYDAAQRRMSLYVDGRKVAEREVPGGPLVLDDQSPLRIGQGPPMAASWPVGRSFGEFPFAFDGLIDEVRVFPQPLEARQIETLQQAFAPAPADRDKPDLPRRKLPTGNPDWTGFAARYTHLRYHEAWDSLFRMSGHPDIVVTFDKLPVRYVLWHGAGYIPMMVTENGCWYSNEFNETWWRGCCEPMSDKKVVFGRVHILEQSPARVVLKWRYPLNNVGYQIYGEDTPTGWGEWCDWYLTIYPDGTCAKRMRVYMTEPHSREWHESMAIFGPDQHPEQVLVTRPALVVGTMEGQIRRYDWIDAPPESIDYDDVILHVANMRAAFDPYTIVRVNQGNVYKQRGSSPYSVFPAWNHWPVAQFPSDGRYVHYPDRAAHSSLTHLYWDLSTEFGDQGAFEEKILLEGMSNLPAEELLAMARSFVDPPGLAPQSDGFTAVFEPAERAYKLTRASSDVKRMHFVIQANSRQPIVNPVLVVANWGSDQPARILIDGRAPDESLDVRQGIVRRANGVSTLVVWMELTSEKPIDMDVALPVPD